jgi:hypothetical protein
MLQPKLRINLLEVANMNKEFLFRTIFNYLLLIMVISNTWASFIILFMAWEICEINKCRIEEYKFENAPLPG